MTLRALCLLLLACMPLRAEPPPNIVLILADDLGPEAVSCYGSDNCRTPNLDAMAAEGMRFDQAFCSPLSTQSRVKLLTGHYGFRNYIGLEGLPENAHTFANHLREAGYRTAISGKWKLGNDPAAVQRFGFDEYCLWGVGQANGSRYWAPDLLLDGLRATPDPETFGPDVFTAFSADFIARHKTQPFLLLHAMALPHWPFVPTPNSPPDATRERSPDHRLRRGGEHLFPHMVHYLDAQIGLLRDTLRRHNLSHSTLILFLSDNTCATNLVNERHGEFVTGGYGSMLDPGTRIPMIACWPGTLQPNQTSDALIDLTDFLPTLAEAAARPLARPHDGHSFLPLLRHQPFTPRPWVFCYHLPRPQAEPTDPRQRAEAIKRHERNVRRRKAGFFFRTQRYKRYSDGSLYDLATDPHERNPLKYPSPEAAAANALVEEQLTTFPPLLPFLPTHP